MVGVWWLTVLQAFGILAEVTEEQFRVSLTMVAELYCDVQDPKVLQLYRACSYM